MERTVVDSTGLSVTQQLVALTDAMGNIITPATGQGGNPNTVKTGQKLIAVLNTAIAISGTSQTLTNGVVAKALASNTNNITVGGSGINSLTDGTGTGYILAPGEAISFGVTNVNLVFINGNAGDGITWAGN